MLGVVEEELHEASLKMRRDKDLQGAYDGAALGQAEVRRNDSGRHRDTQHLHGDRTRHAPGPLYHSRYRHREGDEGAVRVGNGKGPGQDVPAHLYKQGDIDDVMDASDLEDELDELDTGAARTNHASDY